MMIVFPLQELGVDEVNDYTKEASDDVLNSNPADVVIDPLAGDPLFIIRPRVSSTPAQLLCRSVPRISMSIKHILKRVHSMPRRSQHV